MSKNYIQKTILELRQLEELKTELDSEIKERENIIKKYMTMNNLEEMYGINGEKIIYREVISNRFDSKDFKEHFADLYNAYLRKTKNLRFKFSY